MTFLGTQLADCAECELNFPKVSQYLFSYYLQRKLKKIILEVN